MDAEAREDAKRDYQSSLEDLTFNSKPHINMLTILAEENLPCARDIAALIEAQTSKAPTAEKLPVMYLMDSIVKNVGREYLDAFSKNLVSTFVNVFEKVEENTRKSLFKLRSTWDDIFPSKKLYALDVRVNSLDPAWPIKPLPPNVNTSSIHVNPKFLSKTPEEPPAPVIPAPVPVVSTPSHSSDIQKNLTQEQIIRQQLLAKQKQLLELQQKKLELELEQTKAQLAVSLSAQQGTCNVGSVATPSKPHPVAHTTLHATGKSPHVVSKTPHTATKALPAATKVQNATTKTLQQVTPEKNRPILPSQSQDEKGPTRDPRLNRASPHPSHAKDQGHKREGHTSMQQTENKTIKSVPSEKGNSKQEKTKLEKIPKRETAALETKSKSLSPMKNKLSHAKDTKVQECESTKVTEISKRDPRLKKHPQGSKEDDKERRKSAEKKEEHTKSSEHRTLGGRTKVNGIVQKHDTNMEELEKPVGKILRSSSRKRTRSRSPKSRSPISHSPKRRDRRSPKRRLRSISPSPPSKTGKLRHSGQKSFRIEEFSASTREDRHSGKRGHKPETRDSRRFKKPLEERQEAVNQHPARSTSEPKDNVENWQSSKSSKRWKSGWEENKSSQSDDHQILGKPHQRRRESWQSDKGIVSPRTPKQQHRLSVDANLQIPEALTSASKGELLRKANERLASGEITQDEFLVVAHKIRQLFQYKEEQHRFSAWDSPVEEKGGIKKEPPLANAESSYFKHMAKLKRTQVHPRFSRCDLLDCDLFDHTHEDILSPGRESDHCKNKHGERFVGGPFERKEQFGERSRRHSPASSSRPYGDDLSPVDSRRHLDEQKDVSKGARGSKNYDERGSHDSWEDSIDDFRKSPRPHGRRVQEFSTPEREMEGFRDFVCDERLTFGQTGTREEQKFLFEEQFLHKRQRFENSAKSPCLRFGSPDVDDTLGAQTAVRPHIGGSPLHPGTRDGLANAAFEVTSDHSGSESDDPTAQISVRFDGELIPSVVGAKKKYVSEQTLSSQRFLTTPLHSVGTQRLEGVTGHSQRFDGVPGPPLGVPGQIACPKRFEGVSGQTIHQQRLEGLPSQPLSTQRFEGVPAQPLGVQRYDGALGLQAGQQRFEGVPGQLTSLQRFDGAPGQPLGTQGFDAAQGQPMGAQRFDGAQGQPMGVQRFDGAPGQSPGPQRFDGAPGQPGGPQRFDGAPGQPGGPQRFDGTPGQLAGPQRYDGAPGQPMGSQRFVGPPGQHIGPPRFQGAPGQTLGPPRFEGAPGQAMGPPRFEGPPGQPRFEGPPGQPMVQPRFEGPPGPVGQSRFDGLLGQQLGQPRFEGPPGQQVGQPRFEGPPGQQVGQSRFEGPPGQPRFDGPPGQVGQPRFEGPPAQQVGQPRFEGPPGQQVGQPRFEGPPGQQVGQPRFEGQPVGQQRFEGPPGQQVGPTRFEGPPGQQVGPPRFEGPPGQQVGQPRFEGPPGQVGQPRFEGPPMGQPRLEAPPGQPGGPPRFDRGTCLSVGPPRFDGATGLPVGPPRFDGPPTQSLRFNGLQRQPVGGMRFEGPPGTMRFERPPGQPDGVLRFDSAHGTQIIPRFDGPPGHPGPRFDGLPSQQRYDGLHGQPSQRFERPLGQQTPPRFDGPMGQQSQPRFDTIVPQRFDGVQQQPPNNRFGLQGPRFENSPAPRLNTPLYGQPGPYSEPPPGFTGPFQRFHLPPAPNFSGPPPGTASQTFPNPHNRPPPGHYFDKNLQGLPFGVPTSMPMGNIPPQPVPVTGMTHPVHFNQGQTFLPTESQNSRTFAKNQPGAPPFSYSENHLGQLDVNELFSKLLSTGILKTSKTDPAATQSSETAKQPPPEDMEEEEEDDQSEDPSIPDLTNFTIEDLKQRYDSVINRLYTGIQCYSCGMRFTASQTDVYADHLDWHYRQNRTEKDVSRKITHRRWYYGLTDWIEFEEIADLEERAKSLFFEKVHEEVILKTQEAVREKEFQSVPAGRSAVVESCDICQEQFEQYWDEEEEEWHLKNAIRVDEQIYHPSCYEDYKNTSSFLDCTPSPSKIQMENPLNVMLNIVKQEVQEPIGSPKVNSPKIKEEPEERPAACAEERPAACAEEGPTSCKEEGPTSCKEEGPTSCKEEGPTSCKEGPTSCKEGPTSCTEERPTSCTEESKPLLTEIKTEPVESLSV